jgi:hypothetical protein
LKKLLTFVLLAGLACSNPHNQPLPTDMMAARDDPKFKETIQKLPEEERALLGDYLARVMLARAFGADPTARGSAKTIGEAIAEQQKFAVAEKAEEAAAKATKEAEEAAAKALAAKVAAERASAVKAMDEALTVALTSKKGYGGPGVYSDHGVAITVAFQNKSAKVLTGVKGSLVVKDIFGDLITSVGLKIDNEIGAGKTYVWEGQRDTHYPNAAADTKFASTPLDKLKVTWEPDTYLFSDGTSMKAPPGAE